MYTVYIPIIIHHVHDMFRMKSKVAQLIDYLSFILCQGCFNSTPCNSLPQLLLLFFLKKKLVEFISCCTKYFLSANCYAMLLLDFTMVSSPYLKRCKWNESFSILLPKHSKKGTKNREIFSVFCSSLIE